MSREFKCWEIKFKETNKDKIHTTKHLGHMTEDEVVKFFGLEDVDIEWYDIEEVKY